MNKLAVTAAYLLVICVQSIAIIGLMVHSDQQRSRLSIVQEEASDWEQIASSYRSAAARYAVTSEACLQTVRHYQSSIFQPAEMRK